MPWRWNDGVDLLAVAFSVVSTLALLSAIAAVAAHIGTAAISATTRGLRAFAVVLLLVVLSLLGVLRGVGPMPPLLLLLVGLFERREAPKRIGPAGEGWPCFRGNLVGVPGTQAAAFTV